MRLAAVSVDLDEIAQYRRLHALGNVGLPEQAVYDVALPRLEQWARAQGIGLTLFAIAADMARGENAARLRRLSERGYEIGNHSLDHRYDLTLLPEGEMRRQIESGIAVLRGATGYAPVGFRAPGYTLSDRVVDLLGECGALYDSSVFPCPSYYGAKAIVMGGMRLGLRRPASVLGAPGVLLAPTRPYRLGQPYYREGRGLRELPIQVTRRFRLPFIGTSLTLLGADRARVLSRGVLGERFVNLELHGIDFLDRHDGLDALAAYQPDLRIPLDRKLDALSAVVELLQEHNYSFLTLREAAVEVLD